MIVDILFGGTCTIHVLIWCSLGTLVFFGAWLVCQLRDEREPQSAIVPPPVPPVPSWGRDETDAPSSPSPSSSGRHARRGASQ